MRRLKAEVRWWPCPAANWRGDNLWDPGDWEVLCPENFYDLSLKGLTLRPFPMQLNSTSMRGATAFKYCLAWIIRSIFVLIQWWHLESLTLLTFTYTLVQTNGLFCSYNYQLLPLFLLWLIFWMWVKTSWLLSTTVWKIILCKLKEHVCVCLSLKMYSGYYQRQKVSRLQAYKH